MYTHTHTNTNTNTNTVLCEYYTIVPYIYIYIYLVGREHDPCLFVCFFWFYIFCSNYTLDLRKL